MSSHLNRPVRNLRSLGILERAIWISFSLKILVTEKENTLDSFPSIIHCETYQLGFALEGNCGIANAVQMAQGSDMQPQTLEHSQ